MADQLRLKVLVQKCLQRAKGWHLPLHWAAKDWAEELAAIAWAAASECLAVQPTASEREIRNFVFAALMRRYRAEWLYALHCVTPPPRQKAKKRAIIVKFAT